jgi:hypothetical protein
MADGELLTEPHGRLWDSLRHLFNTDRILLAVTYAINFAGFVLLTAATSQHPSAAVVAIAALVLLNGLVMLSLSNSRREAVSLLSTLVRLYADHQLGKYFEESKIGYYRRRYLLWLVLTPTLCATAIVLGLILGK